MVPAKKDTTHNPIKDNNEKNGSSEGSRFLLLNVGIRRGTSCPCCYIVFIQTILDLTSFYFNFSFSRKQFDAQMMLFMCCFG